MEVLDVLTNVAAVAVLRHKRTRIAIDEEAKLPYAFSSPITAIPPGASTRHSSPSAPWRSFT